MRRLVVVGVSVGATLGLGLRAQHAACDNTTRRAPESVLLETSKQQAENALRFCQAAAADAKSNISAYVDFLEKYKEGLDSSLGPLFEQVEDQKRKLLASLSDLRLGGGPSSDHIGWLGATDEPKCKDGTTRFEHILKEVEAGRVKLPASNVYLLVPGFLSQRVPIYFRDTLEHFTLNYGVDARLAAIDTEAPVLENAHTLRLLIEAAHAETGKPVVLIGHSKGGLDSAGALAAFPSLREKVAGVVMIQSPFGGSPIATDALSSEGLGRLAGSLLENVLGGDRVCLEDLTHPRRRLFLSLLPMPPEIPTVCFHSHKSSPVSLVSGLVAYIMTRYGEESDGLVARRDAEVPGSTVVRYPGDMDHLELVLPSPSLDPHKGKDIVVALTLLLLQDRDGLGEPAGGVGVLGRARNLWGRLWPS